MLNFDIYLNLIKLLNISKIFSNFQNFREVFRNITRFSFPNFNKYYSKLILIPNFRCIFSTVPQSLIDILSNFYKFFNFFFKDLLRVSIKLQLKFAQSVWFRLDTTSAICMICVLHMTSHPQPFAHGSTSLWFGLGKTSAVCTIYHAILDTSLAAVLSSCCIPNISNHQYDLSFLASNQKFYIKSMQFWSWLIQNFLGILKFLKIYIKFSENSLKFFLRFH